MKKFFGRALLVALFLSLVRASGIGAAGQVEAKAKTGLAGIYTSCNPDQPPCLEEVATLGKTGIYGWLENYQLLQATPEGVNKYLIAAEKAKIGVHVDLAELHVGLDNPYAGNEKSYLSQCGYKGSGAIDYLPVIACVIDRIDLSKAVTGYLISDEFPSAPDDANFAAALKDMSAVHDLIQKHSKKPTIGVFGCYEELVAGWSTQLPLMAPLFDQIGFDAYPAPYNLDLSGKVGSPTDTSVTDCAADICGAMVGRTDKGLFITTGYFTRDALKEANREGVQTIDLIDGEKLVEKLKELNLGVSVELVEKISIDEKWFEGI